MVIKSIELSNFRNYETLQINFDSGTNILYGDNAQGKTNILEAAYLSGTTKSHKGSKDKEMIRFDGDEAHKVKNIQHGFPLRLRLLSHGVDLIHDAHRAGQVLEPGLTG